MTVAGVSVGLSYSLGKVKEGVQRRELPVIEARGCGVVSKSPSTGAASVKESASSSTTIGTKVSPQGSGNCSVCTGSASTRWRLKLGFFPLPLFLALRFRVGVGAEGWTGDLSSSLTEMFKSRVRENTLLGVGGGLE